MGRRCIWGIVESKVKERRVAGGTLFTEIFNEIMERYRVRGAFCFSLIDVSPRGD
jgi:hypothetical protein